VGTNDGLHVWVGGPGGEGVWIRGRSAVGGRRGRGAVVSRTGECGGVLETERGHELYEGGERHCWIEEEGRIRGRGRGKKGKQEVKAEEIGAKDDGNVVVDKSAEALCCGNEQQSIMVTMTMMRGEEGGGRGDTGGEGGDEDNRRKEEETKFARWWRCNLRLFLGSEQLLTQQRVTRKPSPSSSLLPAADRHHAPPLIHS
jgi:hypothetical protein